ncbi:MAG: internal scaffolding protein [Arizlama microvirus]|nr:MAG: internal scaffolding protein [Arizlama microvirus]
MTKVNFAKQHRTQLDGLGDQISAESFIDCSGDKQLVRQELARETDINYLIKRYPQGGVPGAPGEVDYTKGLHDVFMERERLMSSWERLPDHIKAKYQGWDALLAAVEAGEITNETFRPPTEVPPAPVPEAPRD